MQPRFPQIRAVERTVHRVFALRPAAGRANFAAHAGTMTLGALHFAQLAGDIHKRSYLHRIIGKWRGPIFT